MVKGSAHVVLVGASIVTNAQRAGLLRESLTELEENLLCGGADLEELAGVLLDFVAGNPKDASAELNTFLDLLSEEYGKGRQQWVYLLFSDTKIGELCSTVLKGYLVRLSAEKYGGRISVEALKVNGLGHPEGFTNGLATLFKTITSIIRQHKREGDSVFVHATGGFKPETAIAILAANSPGTGAPVFYVHEHFRRVIRIPAMPIRFRKWEQLTDLIGQLVVVGSAAREALEKKYGKKTVDHAIRLGWAEEKEGEVRPTETGKVLWKQTEGVWTSGN